MKPQLALPLAAATATAAAGYAAYRYIVVRRAPSPPPNPAQAANPLRRFYAEHYNTQMAWLRKWGWQPVSVPSGDGTPLAGYLFRAKTPTRRTALAVHGYRSNGLAEYLFFAPMYLQQLGMNLLIVDDYAHGESGGSRIGFGYLDRLDVLRWTRWIVAHLGHDSEILLQGVSMGAAAVLMAAGEPALPHQVRWVVSDCAFSSMEEELRYEIGHRFHLPAFPLVPLASGWARLLAGYSFKWGNTISFVRNIRVPVLFIHGTEDQFVPVSMAHRLYAACRAPRQLLLVKGAAHAECQLKAPEAYQQAIAQLLGGPNRLVRHS